LKRSNLLLKLFTGTAGVPPAVSAEREQKFGVEYFSRSSHLAVLEAGGTPAVPVKRLTLSSEELGPVNSKES